VQCPAGGFYISSLIFYNKLVFEPPGHRPSFNQITRCAQHYTRQHNHTTTTILWLCLISVRNRQTVWVPISCKHVSEHNYLIGGKFTILVTFVKAYNRKTFNRQTSSRKTIHSKEPKSQLYTTLMVKSVNHNEIHPFQRWMNHQEYLDMSLAHLDFSVSQIT
jgi:hypothetical protein